MLSFGAGIVIAITIAIAQVILINHSIVDAFDVSDIGFT